VSVEALCDLEKHQAKTISGHKLDFSKYLSALFHSVKEELQSFGIGGHSKVVFIGSGAFPLSALTIAKEFGAEVLGVDRDSEAVLLSRQVVKAFGLEEKVSFSDSPLSSLCFVRDATHIIIASLVENKLKVLDQLMGLIKDDAKILVRYGNGVKSVFNYPFMDEISEDWIPSRLSERNSIYDMLILGKALSQKALPKIAILENSL
jgi:hypothetical protein